MKQVRETGEKIMSGIQGRKPDFAMLIDRRGRVVARVKLDENDFGDVVAGRPLVDDALAGYLRDDLWAQNGTMYFVSAAPVIKRDAPVDVRRRGRARPQGHQRARAEARRVARRRRRLLSSATTTSPAARRVPLDHAKMLAAVKAAAGGDPGARLPGEPADRCCTPATTTTPRSSRGSPARRSSSRRYYSVLIKRPETRGFSGTLKAVQQSDLSFANFPWILVGGAFLLALAVGIGLMWIESRPAAAPARRRRGAPREGREASGSPRTSTAASSARSRAA